MTALLQLLYFITETLLYFSCLDVKNEWSYRKLLCCKWPTFSLWCMLCHKMGVLNAFLWGDAYLFWQTDQPPGWSFATELILQLIHYLIRGEVSILAHQKNQALFHHKRMTGSLTDLLSRYKIDSGRPSLHCHTHFQYRKPVGKTLVNNTLILLLSTFLSGNFKGKYREWPL